MLLRNVGLFLLVVCSPSLSSLPAQDPALNRNEFTRQLYTAKVWLKFSAESGPDEFVVDGHTNIRQKWKDCAVAGKAVTDAWDDALESDPLIQKGIECANNFSDRELQAQELRKALRKRYGDKAFDRMEREGKDYQAELQYSNINLDDKELVRLYLWAGDLSYRISTREQLPVDTATNAPAVYGWLAKVEPFDSIFKERGAPMDEEEVVKVFKLGAAAANAVAESRIEAFQAEHSFEPEMLTYLRIRQQADIFEFMGRNYLRSRLQENEAISQAEAHFQTEIGALVGELPGLADSIQKFQRKTIEAEAARTVKLYEEHKVKEPLCLSRSQPTPTDDNLLMESIRAAPPKSICLGFQEPRPMLQRRRCRGNRERRNRRGHSVLDHVSQLCLRHSIR